MVPVGAELGRLLLAPKPETLLGLMGSYDWGYKYPDHRKDPKR